MGMPAEIMEPVQSRSDYLKILGDLTIPLQKSGEEYVATLPLPSDNAKNFLVYATLEVQVDQLTRDTLVVSMQDGDSMFVAGAMFNAKPVKKKKGPNSYHVTVAYEKKGVSIVDFREKKTAEGFTPSQVFTTRDELESFYEEHEAEKDEAVDISKEELKEVMKSLGYEGEIPESMYTAETNIPESKILKESRQRQDEEGAAVTKDLVKLWLREAGKAPLLTPEQEVALAQEMEAAVALYEMRAPHYLAASFVVFPRHSPVQSFLRKAYDAAQESMKSGEFKNAKKYFNIEEWFHPPMTKHVAPELAVRGITSERTMVGGVEVYQFGDLAPHVDAITAQLEEKVESNYSAAQMKERIFKYFNGEQDEYWSPELWNEDTPVTQRNLALMYAKSTSRINTLIKEKAPDASPIDELKVYKAILQVYRWGDIQHVFANPETAPHRVLRRAVSEAERRVA